MRRSTSLWLVSLISLFRIIAALIFAWLAFENAPLWSIAGLYFLAVVSDVVDGYLARRLGVETYFGKVLDLVGDKSLTSVSLLYAAALGITILPLAIIATRELVMLGARMIIVEGTQLFPTNRVLGGMMWLLVWGNTLFLVITRRDVHLFRIANLIYWICAVVFLVNFLARIYASHERIRTSLSRDQ